MYQKSQTYGKDKAKFSLFAGLYKQIVDSVMLHYGVYAWSWDVAGRLTARFGYGPEYEVSLPTESTEYALLFQSEDEHRAPLDDSYYMRIKRRHTGAQATPLVP